MKKIFTAALALAATLPVFANLNTMNYQAVINGSDGTPMKNQEIPMTFTIKNAGEEVFTEKATVKSNEFGMISYEIGSTNDKFADINWGLDDYTLEVAIDLGTGSTSVYTSTIQSVPTALYSINGAEALEVANSAIWRASQAADQLDAFQAQVEESVVTKDDLENFNENIAMKFEEYATIEDVDAFATMVETRFDKIQKQVDATDEQVEGFGDAIANLEDLTGEDGRIMALIKELQTKTIENGDYIANLEEITGEGGNLATLIKDLQNKEATDAENILDIYKAIGENGRIMTLIGELQTKDAELNSNIEDFADMLETKFDGADAKLERYYDALEAEIVTLTKEVDTNKETVLGVNAELVKLNGVADDFAEFKEEYQEDFQKQVETFDGMSTQVNELTTEVENLVKENETNKETVLGINAELTKLNGVADDFADFKKEYEETFQQMATVSAEMSDAINKLEAEYKEDFQKQVETFDGMSTKINEFESEFTEVYKQLEEQNNTMSSLYRLIQDLENEIKALKGETEE